MQFVYDQKEKKGCAWQLYGLHILALILGACSIAGSFGHGEDILCFCLGCQDIVEELLGIISGLLLLATALILRKTVKTASGNQSRMVIDTTAQPVEEVSAGSAAVLPAGSENVRLVAVQYVDPRAWYIDAAWEPVAE